MEQLDYHIFDPITRRQSNKRQPSKDLVSNDILCTVELLIVKQLEEQ